MLGKLSVVVGITGKFIRTTEVDVNNEMKTRLQQKAPATDVRLGVN